MAGVIFGGPGIIAGGFATYFLRRTTDSLPIWQSLGLCGVIYKAGLVILSHTFFSIQGHPPSAAVKKRHLFGDSWAAFCAGVACVTAACLTASFALYALGGLNRWHGILPLFLATMQGLLPGFNSEGHRCLAVAFLVYAMFGLRYFILILLAMQLAFMAVCLPIMARHG